LKNHVNVGGIDYGQWAAAFDDAETTLLGTSDKDLFETRLQQILGQLKTSHVMFYDNLPRRFPAQYTIGATLQPVNRSGDDKVWGFLDIFEGGPSHNYGILPGQLLLSVDGKPATPPVQPSFAIGTKHKLVVADFDGANHREINVTVPTAKGGIARPPIITPEPLKWWFPEPRIAVLKVGWFPGFAGIRFSRELAKMMKVINQHSCQALVVDLRGNLGGSLGFISLVSYLCPGRLPVGYSLTPKALTKAYGSTDLPKIVFPDVSRIGGVAEFWSKFAKYSFKDKSVVLFTQGLGPQPFHGKIVVLINTWTSSAAEIAAAFAKEHGLAVTIGTTTAGKVLSAASVKVGGGYWLRLPFLAWYSWPQDLIEGVGVLPDIRVDADPESLASGSDPQMLKAMEVLRARLDAS
jgi:C-terminal processing protease CtpA/Prc